MALNLARDTPEHKAEPRLTPEHEAEPRLAAASHNRCTNQWVSQPDPAY